MTAKTRHPPLVLTVTKKATFPGNVLRKRTKGKGRKISKTEMEGRKRKRRRRFLSPRRSTWGLMTGKPCLEALQLLTIFRSR